MDAQLFALLRCFFSLTSPSELQFPDNCSLTQINNFLVNNILLNDHFRAYPPSDQYQQRFWKWAIENLEDRARKCIEEEFYADFEIDARIYNHYVSLMPGSGPATGSMQPSIRSQICGRGLPGRAAPQHSYITHYWNPRNPNRSTSEFSINLSQYQTTTLLESRTTIENGTTGLRTWMASFVLSHYVIKHPEVITSRRVLELGSGIGFLGIVVASLQKFWESKDQSSPLSSLFLTDVNNEVLLRCRDNINLSCNLSSRHHNIHFLNLDWSESTDSIQCSALKTLIQHKIDPDVILGADVVFDPSLIPFLVGTLKIALFQTESRSPRYAIIALTVRNESTVNIFIAHVRESHLVIEEMNTGIDETTFSETFETHSSFESVKMFRIMKAT
ncbi:Protein-lysine N-methyltransferase EEF2KMT [Psilocybe cubensis]|uniref:Uncharacterized protein n=2 Tax=Psilocybe cubensis TaxID=181762 RepID=A0A8H7Y6W2_PSICU|nr:Protein-lysine N-methyltransferase EEF2KMT [Psilocybe cubensis]KAH9486393.1 Protein-lysine N-methyltransferase EEF2KMT [Psilocybe cubensis]